MGDEMFFLKIFYGNMYTISEVHTIQALTFLHKNCIIFLCFFSQSEIEIRIHNTDCDQPMLCKNTFLSSFFQF